MRCFKLETQSIIRKGKLMNINTFILKLLTPTGCTWIKRPNKKYKTKKKNLILRVCIMLNEKSLYQYMNIQLFQYLKLHWFNEQIIIPMYTGQTFCDLPTHLHLFYRIFHAIRIKKCNFFLVYSVILGIFWVTLSCKHM